MSDFKSYASEKELKKLGSYIIFDKETGDIKRIIFPNNLQVGLAAEPFSSAVFTISGTVEASTGFIGTLSSLADGRSYLRAGTNVTITSASDGQITITAAGGSGSPGGSDTQLQYNDGGSFGGISAFTWDDTDLTVGTTTKLKFRDAGLFVHSPDDGYLVLDADTRLAITGSGAVHNAISLITDNAAGGIDIDSGTGGYQNTSTGKIHLTSSINSGDGNAIQLLASAGGIQINAVGTSGEDVSIINTGGSINLSATEAASDAINIDSSGGIDIDAADEITLTTTTADGHISLVSAHTAGVAFHIDANTNADSEVQIDAGILDIDVTGNATIDSGGIFSADAVGASNLTTHGVLTLSGSDGLNIASDEGEIDLTSRQGTVDINAGGAITLDAAAASAFTTSAAAITIDGKTGIVLEENNAAIITISDDRDITTTNTRQVHLDATGVVNINSSADVISIGNDDVNQDINVGTNGTRTIQIGAGDGTTTTTINSRAGTLTLDGTGQTVDLNSATLDIDTSGAVNIEAAGTASDITLITAHTAGVAFLLDANANAGSIVDIDAGILQIDATGVAGINSGGTLSLGTANSGVAVNIGHGTSETTINDNLTVTGNTTVAGSLGVNGIVSGSLGLSGSLTRLVDGTSYLAAGSNVTITSASNGQVTIAASAGGGGGGGSGDYQAKSANFTAGTSEYMFGITTSGGHLTGTLPAASSAGSGKQYIFKDAAGYAGQTLKGIHIATDGSEKIDGAAAANILVNSGSISIMTDGSNWFVMGIS